MKYLSPEMQIEEVEDDDIVTLSIDPNGASESTTSESNVGGADASGSWAKPEV